MEPSRPILSPITRFRKIHVHAFVIFGAWELQSLSLNNPPSLFALLEHATGSTGSAGSPEMVSRTAARSPPSTRARGQDDGSYTNSLKQRNFLKLLSNWNVTNAWRAKQYPLSSFARFLYCFCTNNVEH